MKNEINEITIPKILPDARSIVVVGLNYHSCTGIPACADISAAAGRDACATQPHVARYAWGERDYHDVQGEKLDQLAAFIVELGGRAKWHVDTGPIIEHDIAQRVGIGFVGKHTNLERARHDPEPLISEHVAWAVGQIGKRQECQSLC